MSAPKPTGIIGAGAFGLVMANVASANAEVLVYTRSADLAARGNAERTLRGYSLRAGIRLVSEVTDLTEACDLICPIVPSTAFRKTIRSFAPHLTPRHFIVHGTKGFDVPVPRGGDFRSASFTRANVRTMSEVVREESSVIRIGCLSGPNLSSEIDEGQPTATVVASNFAEVVAAGQAAFSTEHFQVFGSRELLGAEIAGALKNGVAVGSGVLAGRGLGRNIQAILLTRGLVEMVSLGKAMGAGSRAFLGSAGIGDLIATATSTSSRNYALGERIGRGESLAEITAGSEVLTEGVRTLRIVAQLARHYRLHLPIFTTLHAVVLEGYPVDRALRFLMTYPYNVDVDFV